MLCHVFLLIFVDALVVAAAAGVSPHPLLLLEPFKNANSIPSLWAVQSQATGWV